jgi:hypothetical protein|tara:strand:- start:72686 stop:75163 length:2478 start_codon:yes stop_codon:yes gene_type:complete
MKKLILVFAISFVSSFIIAATGGPDAYGYTWIDSNEPGGPSYSWIDITTTGTLISGLADDNSVGMIPMGMSFHYYWGDFNALKIGSNGWLGFDNIGNIASCFPSIPTAGGAGDNFLAPLMSDLIFGPGVPGAAYYKHDAVNNRFIVSYIGVPHWQAAAPGYFGISTFQVILSGADSSITFQYQNSNLGGGPCLTPTVNQVIGIEGPTGTLGLSHSINLAAPNANYAVKFIYPPVVLIQIQDLTPFWTLNTGNKAQFYYTNAAASIPVNVKNTGNANVTTSFTVNVKVKNAAGAIVLNSTQTVTGGLASGDDTLLLYTYTPTVVGQYSIESLVTNSNDINPGNNLKVVEMEVVQQSSVNTRLSNVNVGDAPSGQWSLTGGINDGGGLHIIPPSYPYIITALKARVTVTSGSNDAVLQLLADDGINNSPGTVLNTGTISNVGLSGWVTYTLPTPDTIFSGGLYIAWLQDIAFPGIVLGTYNQAPLSRRNYELVAGGWAEWRNNETEELMLEVVGKSICAGFSVLPTNLSQISCNGLNDGTITVSPSGLPNSGPFTYSWTNFSGTTATASGLGAGLYTVTITNGNGCQTSSQYNIVAPPAIFAQTTSTAVLCFGGTSGTASVTATGGTAPLTVDWGSNNPNLLSAGNKIFTVTDANGCILVDTVVISQPAQIVLTSTQVNENLGGDGSIDLTVTGGTPPYTYSWTNGAGTAQDPTNLSAGTYNVTVTDANNCLRDLSITILNVLGLSEEGTSPILTISPNPTSGKFEIVLNSADKFTIEIVDPTGRKVYEQITSEEKTSIDLSKEGAGVYYVVVKNDSMFINRKIVIE